MKHFFLSIILIVSLFACGEEDILTIDQDFNKAENIHLKTTLTSVKVSNQAGATNYAKLVAAIAKADASNEIVIDVHIDFNSSDKAIVIDKDDVNLRGATLTSGKYKLVRAGIYNSYAHIFNSLIVVKANNVSIDNIQFLNNSGKGYRCVFAGSVNSTGQIDDRYKLYSNLDFLNCSFKQVLKTDGSRGLFFEGSFKNVTIDNCYFNNWFGLVARDCPSLDTFTINKNTFTNGDHQISLDGALLGERDPTYDIGVDMVNQRLIKVTNNTFNVCNKFNLAIANTRNVFVENNTMMGGTVDYSQCIHIEDESKNITIEDNTLSNSADCAILLYSTGKVGHGQGRDFTEDEKMEKGSGNVIIRNNTVDSKNPTVKSTYLKGYIEFESNNVLKSTATIAVNVLNSNVGAEVIFKDNNSTFNGSKFETALTNEIIEVDKNITIIRP